VNVFVLSLQNKPLMPTTPRRARLWLKAKRARIVSLIPFTIQLRFEPSSLYTQTVKVGVDSGFQTVGVSAIANGEVLYQAEVSIRTDVKSRLDRRRQYRRNRRGRKTRYRPARFNNRVRANGWLPPSLRSKAEATVKTVLQVEHILPKSRGGTDRVSNLTLACAQCNQAKDKQTATEFGFPDLEKQAQKPLVAAAHVSSIKNWVVETLSRLYGASQVSTSYGYETKYKRIQVLKLPKTHAHDAIAIACRVGERVITNNVCYQIRCLPRGNYQLFNGQRGEHKVSAPKKLYGWKLYEMVEAKGLIGYIGGRRVKGSFALRSPVTGKLFCEVRPSKLRRVCRPQHGWLFIQERIVLPLSAQDSSLRTQ
jgi:5-methylcytosine-specific restriction endonuclease McrA